MKVIVWVLYALLVIYNLMDLLQTCLLSELGVLEANPIYIWLSKKFGLIPSIIGFKVFTLGFLAIALQCYLHRKRNL